MVILLLEWLVTGPLHFDLLQTYLTNKSRDGILSLSIILTVPDLQLLLR